MSSPNNGFSPGCRETFRAAAFQRDVIVQASPIHRKLIMKPTHLIGVALALSLAPIASFSQSGESRSQVKAEAREAVRLGEFQVDDEGRNANEVNPKKYPPKPVVQGLTREQVIAETAMARKNGEIPFGDLDQRPRDLTPNRYPPAALVAGLTRAEVKTETQAAIRAGDIQIGDDGRTEAEKDPARYAGAPASAPKLRFTHRSPSKQADLPPEN